MTSKDWSDMARRLAEIYRPIQLILDEEISYWSPDNPPGTTLFGYFGQQIVKDIDSIDQSVLRDVFNYVESVVDSNDEPMSTIMTTGFIEAVANRAIENGKWEIISGFLGPKSIAHAQAWLDFTPEAVRKD